MSEITPTADHLNDPYVLQLIEALSKLDDRIEELEAENERLTEQAIAEGRIVAKCNGRIEELESYLDEEREKNEKQVRMTMDLRYENEKLREALGSIALCYVEREYSDFDVGINYCARQARRALNSLVLTATERKDDE